MKTRTWVLLVLVVSARSWAGVGAGIHIGYDFTLSMADTRGRGDAVALDSIELTYQGLGLTLTNTRIPVYVSRSGWTPFIGALGAKLFVNSIPLIDAVEVSGNLSMWEYLGTIVYPDTISPSRAISEILQNPSDPLNFIFAEQPVTLEAADMSYLGMDLTPFAKLQVDLTVRKGILHLGDVLDIDAGGGYSLVFSTPTLSAEIVGEAIEETTDGSVEITSIRSEFTNEQIRRHILDKITERLRNPSSSLHVAAGAMFRVPALFLGIYADVKYMFPITPVDPDIYLGGYGMFVDAGVAITL